MSKQDFDFRWGVPLLDNQPGFAKVYEFMLDHYAEVITRDEFLCIMHLARYHYNSRKGESRPSLDTIAREMGYGHKNSVSRLVQSLEKKAMLKVTRRPGFTSIYNANLFTERMMALAGITLEGDTLQGDGGITPQSDGVSHPVVPEEEKDTEIKEEERDFLSETKKSNRERIRDVLVDILADGMTPETEYLLKPFDNGVDALVIEFRAIWGKKRLTDDLTSKILAAIRAAYEDEANWSFNNATAPNRAVIGHIVTQGRSDKDAKAQRAADHAAASDRNRQAMAALAERQVQAEERDPWWERVLGELALQMTNSMFDTCLKGTRLLERKDRHVVVAVPNEQAKEWLDERLRGVIKRTVAADGVTEVVFKVVG